MFQEFQLSVAQKLQAGFVQLTHIIRFIFDVIGPAGPVGNRSPGTRFEHPVGDHGKAHPAVHHVPIVDIDSLFDRRWIEKVRVMGRVRAMNDLHHLRRFRISSRVVLCHGDRVAPVSPEVTLEYIMVVRGAKSRPVPH